MRNHLYRSIAIWAVLVIALVNIYPTAGWLALSDEARQARLDKWQAEDDEYAKTRSTSTQDFFRSVKRWAEFDRERVINLGLDLQGGVHMVLSFDIEDLEPGRLEGYRDANYTDAQISEEIQQTVLDQITRRVNEFEAKEPVIQTLGTNQIQVQLPGEKDVERAQRLITKVAQLTFHMVASRDQVIPFFEQLKARYPEEFRAFIKRPAMAGGLFECTVENYDRVRRLMARAKDDGLVPAGLRVAFSQTPKPYEDQSYSIYLMDDAAKMTGEGLTRAAALPNDRQPPNWMIAFEFNGEAATEFGKLTEENTGREMAIVIDDVVVSAPRINSKITSNGVIEGTFEPIDARDLAIALNSGSMAVPIREEYSGVVGATLGRDSVNKGVVSAMIGLGLSALLVALYYRTAGIVACIGLAVNALLIVASMAYFGMTLTLPGIAGLILSVGMAVDANVLIYERIREELKLGHTLASSVNAGFQRAAITILDSNVTTLIAAAMLFQFGTGAIEGFAVTLFIGVIASLFTALVLARAQFDFMLDRGWIKSLPMMNLVRNDLGISFMSYRKLCLSGSLLLIAGTWAFFGYRGMDNFGVDFSEGTSITLSIDSASPVDEGQVREALIEAGFTDPQVQRSAANVGGLGNSFLVRVGETGASLHAAAQAASSESEAILVAQADPAAAPAAAESNTAPVAAQAEASAAPLHAENVAQRVRAALAPLSGSGEAGVELGEVQSVGPAAGAQLRFDALNATVWAIIFIMIYVAFRFELKFSVGAVIALIHDVAITMGIMSLLGRQVSMSTVAAILTVIGYSLNDTIVVYDRIREDLRLYRGKGLKLAGIIDLAVNATLSRTMLTSVTTLVVLAVLFFFGGDTLQDFSLTLIIGIVVGTYSSIFVAAPVVHVWSEYFAKHAEEDKPQEGGSRRRRKAGETAKGAAV